MKRAICRVQNYATSSIITKIPSSSNPIYLRYHRLLSPCINLHFLLQLHCQLIAYGVYNSPSTATHLLKSYIQFKKLNFARNVFDSMSSPTVFLYNSMIRAYNKEGNYKEAIKLYHLMLNRGLVPDKYTYTFVLKACTCALEFEEGVLVHGDVEVRGLENDGFIATGLVDLYSKMGDLEMARKVFDKMKTRDVVAWNAMILGLAKSGSPEEALRFVRFMNLGDVEVNLVTVLNLVPAVARLGDIGVCRCIHGYVIQRGFELFVCNGLIDMYAKCGDIDVAYEIFSKMENKDDASWGIMMAGYVHNEYFLEVLELIDLIKRENVRLNKVAAVSVLTAAMEMEDLCRGKEVHDCVIQQGLHSDVSVATSILTMYVRCGELDNGKQLFQELNRRDLIAWSAIITAFLLSGYTEEALSLFREMQHEWLKVNKVTLASLLPGCGEVTDIRLGKSLHCYAVKADYDSDVAIGTGLVSMYAKHGLLDSSLAIFNGMPHKDVVTWNALINGYLQIGDAFHAMETFSRLKLSEVCPDLATAVALLKACGLVCDVDHGSSIHGQIIKYGMESDCRVNVALIDMYAKCGNLSSAEFLFTRTETKNEATWNAMIAGYAHSGYPKEAVVTFSCMKANNNVQPNLITIVCVLPAVASLAALKEGMSLHACILRMGFQSNALVGNSLVDMYAKCGQLDYSEKIFHEMDKNTVSWNVMLAGYAVNGRGDQAILLFARMKQCSIKMDSLSFLNVLSACRHAGLVEEGRKIFHSMSEHQLVPDIEHYACMVDLLGRAGLFDEIMDLIKSMPMEPDVGVWGALLGACTAHSNTQLAEFVLDRLTKLDPRNATNYAILSGIYSKVGRWGDAGNTRSKIINMGLKKHPACSWI